MKKPKITVKKALILSGDGINAEAESAWACQLAGFKTEIRHINDLIAADFNQDRLTAEYSLGGDFREEIARTVVQKGAGLLALKKEILSLEDIYLKLTQETPAAEQQGGAN